MHVIIRPAWVAEVVSSVAVMVVDFEEAMAEVEECPVRHAINAEDRIISLGTARPRQQSAMLAGN